MYNQGHNQQHAGIINASGTRGFASMMSTMNGNRPVQHHSQQAHGHHTQHHQDHNGHATHQTNYVNHQQNQSGGTLSNTANHFTPSHLQNGTPNNAYTTPTKPMTEHWQKQVDIADKERQMTTAHPHARNASSASKTIMPGAANGFNKDGEKEERYRTGVVKGSETEDQIWHDLDMGGANLRVMGAALFSYDFLNRLYFNNNKLKVLPSAIGKLKLLSVLDLSLNELTEIPPEIGMLVNLKELLLVDNQLEILPFELGNLFQLQMLAIDGNPLIDEQRNIIAESGVAGIIDYLREHAPMTDSPEDREWVVLDDSDNPAQDKFSVLSFNILCDKAATQNQFGYAPTSALEWDTRKDMILGEIRGRGADIVCLQELDMVNYHHFFREKLAHDDYKGIYWPRTRSKTMSETQQNTVDGCATFVKNSKYIILDKQMVDFAGTAIQRPDMKGEHDVFNRIMIRDNIAVITFLENRITGSRLIVVNVHIFWDEQYKDVKLVQVAILMEAIQKHAEKYSKWPATPEKEKVVFRFANGDKDGEETEEEVIQAPVAPSMEYSDPASIPLVLCGDFNSTTASGVYDLITSGQLPAGHPDLGDFKYGNFTRDGMKHQFSLKSSYNHIGELPFTNYTPGFTGVIDYIMYSTNALQVTGLLGKVDPDYLQRVPGFPNPHFPSDHLALQSEFVVKGKKERKVTEVDFGPQKDRRH
ncbi:hypothetical protein BLS_001116 [Venturia inaequalis]|nr:hypothetical protein BLS_001116 [Venturia inaequalis]RDI78573.1 hypothetical protein Vi05172_g11552 [Venturia inaequalis]